MVNTIAGTAFPSPQATFSTSSTSLTVDQQQLISDTLAQYDADNLSQADARSIVETFSEAGINPGDGLRVAMEEAGFDAKAVGDTAGLQGPPPQGGPRPGSEGVSLDEETLSELYALLDQYYGEDSTDEEKTGLLESISELLGSRENILNTVA